MSYALTIDVEEYFHAANFEPVLPPARWHSLESRVEASTMELLELLNRKKQKATFFILGYVAHRHPELVRTIAAQGHEIASHGYGHRLVCSQTPAAFYRDVRRTKLLLENFTGKEVIGYRAPNFSITDETPWAYELLVKAGYKYDSSLHPVRHPRYGNRHRAIVPQRIQTPAGPLTLLPLSVWQLPAPLSMRLPIAGGAYWRLFPMLYLLTGLHQSAASTHFLNCYLHPWEIDAEQPHVEKLPLLTRIRHFSGTRALLSRLERIADEFSFTTLNTIYQTLP